MKPRLQDFAFDGREPLLAYSLRRRLRVEPTDLSLLSPWNAFYAVVGNATAALTGLQFVATALGADVKGGGSEGATSAFGTPTVVHFCAVLLISTSLSAPWPSLPTAASALGACALAGFLYTLLVLRRARRQTEYVPVLEDWIWHSVLPLAAYTALGGAAIALQHKPAPSLFVSGGGTLLLLFVGIHNAWDSVTYIARRRRQERGVDGSTRRAAPAPTAKPSR
jgi:hypothetical protein